MTKEERQAILTADSPAVLEHYTHLLTEETERRGYNDKHYRLPAGHPLGTHFAKIDIDHVHYKDIESGEFKDISWQLLWDEEKRGWGFTTHSFHPFIPEYADGWVEFRDVFHSKDQTTKFKAQAAHVQGRLVPFIYGITNLNAVIYDDAFGPGVDYIVYFTATDLKKVVRVRDGYTREADLNFDFEVEFPNGKAIKRGFKDNIAYELDITRDKVFDTNKQTLIGNDPVDGQEWHTYLRPFFAWDSGAFDNHHQTNIRVAYFRKNGKQYLRKIIPAAFLTTAVGDVFTDDVTSYYAGAGDGHVYKTDGSSWANARGATNGTGVDYTGTANMQAAGQHYSSTWYVYREFFPIDTSGLGAGATITAAVFHLRVTNGNGSTTGYLVQTTQASTSQLVTEDFDQVGAVDGGNASAPGSYPSDFAITMNATGRGWINKTGITQIGLRQDKDFTNTSPPGETLLRWFNDSADNATQGNRPYLTVTYTSTTAPTVTTQDVTNIGTNSATGNGNVTSDGGAAITERGVCWALTSNPTTANSKATAAGTTGAFTAPITGLSPSTTYHVRAYAINSVGTSYGADVQFTTSAQVINPTVTTDQISNIRNTAATIEATSANGNGSAITEQGFVYSTGATPTTADNKKVINGAVGTYSGDIIGLTAGTTYFVRGYVIAGGVTYYGNTRRFITASTKVNKHYFYRVYDDGVLKGTWVKEVISEPSFRVAINGGPGEMVVQLARVFDDFGEDVDVKLNNRVDCYVVDDEEREGKLIYTGYISGYRPVIKEVREYLEVTIFGYVAELQRMILRNASGNTTITYNSYDPAAILRDVIDKYRAQGGTLNYTAATIPFTYTSVSYTFNTNTIKECFDKIIELCPVGWYYRIDPDGMVYLQPKPITADHSFTIGLDIEDLETFRRIEDCVNQVLFTGGGSPPLFRKYNNTSSIDSYGLYEKKIVDQRVTVAATASTIANRMINTYKDPEIRSRFKVLDSNGPGGKGYDIESIKVGETVDVKNLKAASATNTLWDVGQWDVDVWDQTLSSAAADIIQILSIEYHPDYIIVEASSRLPQVAKRIEDINRNLENTQTVDNPAAPS